MKKELTYTEFIDLAMKNYNKGGDAYVECWDEMIFNDYTRMFGGITKTRAMEMIKSSYYDEIEEQNMFNY